MIDTQFETISPGTPNTPIMTQFRPHLTARHIFLSSDAGHSLYIARLEFYGEVNGKSVH